MVLAYYTTPKLIFLLLFLIRFIWLFLFIYFTCLMVIYYNVTFAPNTQAHNNLHHRNLLTTIGRIHQTFVDNSLPTTQ
jgi:hypothetical protein